MSFSTDVKKELSDDISPTRHCRLAELTAITSVCGEYSVQGTDRITLMYHSENYYAIRTAMWLIKKLFHDCGEVSVASSRAWSSRTYTIVINDSDFAKKMLFEMGFLRKDGVLYELSLSHADLIPKNICCKRAFLKGAFICNGTISEPRKSYHLEYACASDERAFDIQRLFLGFGIITKIARRKNRVIVYVKEGGLISDILSVIGATSAMLEFENIRILRDISGNMNRAVNCETANMNKSVTAGVAQIKQIELIKEKRGLESLPPSLREVAELRLANPDMSLKDLGALLDPPLGKSGINHRFEKIKEIAAGIKGGFQ